MIQTGSYYRANHKGTVVQVTRATPDEIEFAYDTKGGQVTGKLPRDTFAREFAFFS